VHVHRMNHCNLYDLITLPQEIHKQVAMCSCDYKDSASFQASVAASMRNSLFSDVTQRKLVVIDVSAQPICPIFKGQAVR
jgi:hypothetical protein